ncbi:MAG: hypothetical protein ACJ74F_28035 [Mycobacterium sp.]|uniref:hypothetical protein n=1 Tax=Mycobacterium sp. TaxID=1785 RepID=UPI00389A29C4
MPITSPWLLAIPRAIAIHPAPPPERSVAPCLGIVGSATHGNTGHKTPTLWGPRVGLERASLGTHGASGLDSREWRSEMADNVVQVRFGTPGNVLEVQVGTVEVDVPRSVGYYGGLAAAVGLGLIEPPLALFIAAVPAFKALTNTALPRPVRFVGEVLEGAAKPVGSDAEGVIQLVDQNAANTKATNTAPKRTTPTRTARARSK